MFYCGQIITSQHGFEHIPSPLEPQSIELCNEGVHCHVLSVGAHDHGLESSKGTGGKLGPHKTLLHPFQRVS